jgi:hypothetical protein
MRNKRNADLLRGRRLGGTAGGKRGGAEPLKLDPAASLVKMTSSAGAISLSHAHGDRFGEKVAMMEVFGASGASAENCVKRGREERQRSAAKN